MDCLRLACTQLLPLQSSISDLHHCLTTPSSFSFNLALVRAIPMPPSTVDLCLACSSSLPPHRPSSSKLPGDTIFRTSCCNKPICPTCISSNPRLSRYNPCLHCLNGVGVVHARSPTALAHSSSAPQNFDGGVHDEDVFALGDDEDDSDDEADSGAGESTPPTPATPPPAYAEVDEPADAGHGSQVTPSGANNVQDEVNKDAAPSCGAPSKYYIQPKDTLVGIALRFGVDVSIGQCCIAMLATNTNHHLGPFIVSAERPSAKYPAHHAAPPAHSHCPHPPALCARLCVLHS